MHYQTFSVFFFSVLLITIVPLGAGAIIHGDINGDCLVDIDDLLIT